MQSHGSGLENCARPDDATIQIEVEKKPGGICRAARAGAGGRGQASGADHAEHARGDIQPQHLHAIRLYFRMNLAMGKDGVRFHR